jgi:hypothetical protein
MIDYTMIRIRQLLDSNLFDYSCQRPLVKQPLARPTTTDTRYRSGTTSPSMSSHTHVSGTPNLSTIISATSYM